VEAATDRLRLSETVYEDLLEMILSGQLKPGQPVSELELSRTLGVSRTPVHEAVGLLAKDGLVIQATNRRPVIAAFSGDDIFDIYEMRRILETEAAAKAAMRIDRQRLAYLDRLCDQYAQDQSTPEAVARWVEFDDIFHSAIAAASGSRRLEQDILRYRRMHRVFNRTHSDVSLLMDALAEHRAILDGLRNRDPEAARLAMQHHLEEWQRFFVRHLS
jgi:DNA-binding GntR family transcriptional regulator